GHGPRAVDGVRHRAAEQRARVGGERARPRHDVPRPAAGGAGRGRLSMPSTLAFLRAHARPGGARVTVTEVAYRRGSEPLPADLYLPARSRGRLPGFVILHGLTRTGRAHAALRKFVRAVAASG